MSRHASSGLRLCRGCLWVGLGWPLVGRPQETVAEEIEVCPAKHMALHH